MGKFIWGSVVTLVMLFGFASVAQAGLIPPTSSCQAFVKKQIKKALKAGPDAETSPAENKRMAELLESKGCISDAEPLYTEVEAKPFTDQCRDAAAKADKYWRTAGGKISKRFKPWVKRGRAHERRIKLIDRRIKRMRQDDRKGQAAALLRTRKQVNRAFQKRYKKAMAKFFPAIKDIGYDSILITTEFASLRCVDMDLPDDGRFNTPVLKAIEKNAGLIFISILFLALDAEQGSNASSSAQPAEPSLIESSIELLSRR